MNTSSCYDAGQYRRPEVLDQERRSDRKGCQIEKGRGEEKVVEKEQGDSVLDKWCGVQGNM